MQQRNTNSIKYDTFLKDRGKQELNRSINVSEFQPSLDLFFSDEEPENFESQKEDMKLYLNRLNKRIDILVDAWKKAENKMSKMGDHKVILEQAQKVKEIRQQQLKAQGKKTSHLSQADQDDQGSEIDEKKAIANFYGETYPITEFLKEEIKKSIK